MSFEAIIQYAKEIEHVILASVFGVVNALIRPPKESVWFYVVEYVISVSVATLVGFITSDLGFNTAMSFSLTAISALLARDMLSLIIGFGDYVTDHRDTLFKKLFNSLVGKLPDKEIAKDEDKNG